ncbi:uncharacterized protein LOC119111553, partial [Pollicipes pollicipes]|uniref:uncharacterized protein LOC119111553 n=1 Tax=Pollicipes pollicipes TaxID=41117 RepID=UPI001884E505
AVARVQLCATADCPPRAPWAALLALAAAQDGYSYGAPETGYDYKEPVNPQGSGNTPGGSVIKPAGDEDHHHGGSSDPLQWLRDSVPGEPGVDYPIYATIPPTSFSCDGRVPGYYADVEAGCQPFHVCNTMVGDESMKLSFLCPNGTIFNQEGFACQWWSDVDCASAEQFYNKNEEIGKVPESGRQQQRQQRRWRAKPAVRPVPNQYIPPTTTTTTTTVRPPPGLYNLPRN